MRIAVKKDGTMASSSAQSAAANLDSMPTVEDLCAVLKEGASGTNVDPREGRSEIATDVTDVVSMIENGSLLDLFSTMNESVSVDDDVSKSSTQAGAANMITLYSGIEEDHQDGPSAFQPIHKETITGPQPFLTFPVIQEIFQSKDIPLPPQNVPKENGEKSSRKTLPPANLNKGPGDQTINPPNNMLSTDPLPDCVRTEVVRLEDPTPGPSHRSESNNETNVQPEAQEDNIDIDENDLDQAFVQVFNHFGKTSAASEIVKTLLDDTDTLKKCIDTVKKGLIMVCPSCLCIFTTVGPYIDHHPDQCNKPASSKIEKLLDRATVSELALLLWRNAVVAELAKLPSGEKFIQQENQLHNELHTLWIQCSTHQMVHCHDLFNRVAVHILTRKPVLPALEKVYKDTDNKKKKARKVAAQRATAVISAGVKAPLRPKRATVSKANKHAAIPEPATKSKTKKRTAEDLAINAMLNDTEGLIGPSNDPSLTPGSIFDDFGNRSSRRVQNTKRRKILSENEEFDMMAASDSGVGTLTPESDRPSEMMTPFTDPMTDGMTQLSDSELAGSDVEERQVSQTSRRLLPLRNARPRPCMNAEDQQKKLQKGPPVANEVSGSKKRMTPTRAAKTKNYFDFAGNDCFESVEVIDHVKPSTSKAHRRRKSSNDRSPPPLHCLSPKSPNSVTLDNDVDWMPTLSPNNTSSPNDDNAMDDTRSISPLSDTESIVFICDTPGTRKKSPKVVNIDDDDSRPLDIKPEANFDNVDLPEDELERLFTDTVDDDAAVAAAFEIGRFEDGNVEYEEEEPGEGEFVVNQILNRRLRNSVQYPKDSDYEYLVSWEGYGDAENTWEPYENLFKCASKLKDYLDTMKERAFRNRKGKRM